MTEKNKRWQLLLDSFEYSNIDSSIRSGFLHSVKVNEEKHEYRLILSFNELVDADLLFDFLDKFKIKLMDACKLNNVRFTVLDYNISSFDYALVYKYFLKAIEVWSK